MEKKFGHWECPFERIFRPCSFLCLSVLPERHEVSRFAVLCAAYRDSLSAHVCASVCLSSVCVSVSVYLLCVCLCADAIYVFMCVCACLLWTCLCLCTYIVCIVLCVCVSLCVGVWLLRMRECRAKYQCHMFPIINVHFISLDKGFPIKPRAQHFSLTGWPGSPTDLPVSTYVVLNDRIIPACPVFLHGRWHQTQVLLVGHQVFYWLDHLLCHFLMFHFTTHPK